MARRCRRFDKDLNGAKESRAPFSAALLRRCRRFDKDFNGAKESRVPFPAALLLDVKAAAGLAALAFTPDAKRAPRRRP